MFACPPGDVPSLATQAKLMFHGAWNAQPMKVVRANLGISENIASGYRWRGLLKTWVLRKQAGIQNGGDYEDCEADEAVFWTEYVGLKTRGQRASLVLDKGDTAKTLSKRAAPVRLGCASSAEC